MLVTTTIGAAHSLLSTGINSPSSTQACRGCSTFSLIANGTGRCWWNFGVACSLTVITASISFNTPNSSLNTSSLNTSAYSVSSDSWVDGPSTVLCTWVACKMRDETLMPSNDIQSCQTKGIVPLHPPLWRTLQLLVHWLALVCAIHLWQPMETYHTDKVWLSSWADDRYWLKYDQGMVVRSAPESISISMSTLLMHTETRNFLPDPPSWKLSVKHYQNCYHCLSHFPEVGGHQCSYLVPRL